MKGIGDVTADAGRLTVALILFSVFFNLRHAFADGHGPIIHVCSYVVSEMPACEVARTQLRACGIDLIEIDYTGDGDDLEAEVSGALEAHYGAPLIVTGHGIRTDEGEYRLCRNRLGADALDITSIFDLIRIENNFLYLDTCSAAAAMKKCDNATFACQQAQGSFQTHTGLTLPEQAVIDMFCDMHNDNCARTAMYDLDMDGVLNDDELLETMAHFLGEDVSITYQDEFSFDTAVSFDSEELDDQKALCEEASGTLLLEEVLCEVRGQINDEDRRCTTYSREDAGGTCYQPEPNCDCGTDTAEQCYVAEKNRYVCRKEVKRYLTCKIPAFSRQDVSTTHNTQVTLPESCVNPEQPPLRVERFRTNVSNQPLVEDYQSFLLAKAWNEQRSYIGEIVIEFSEPPGSIDTSSIHLVDRGLSGDKSIEISLRDDDLHLRDTYLYIDLPPLEDSSFELVLNASVRSRSARPLLSGNSNWPSSFSFSQLAGNFNGDLGVNVLDFSTLQNWFGATEAPEFVDLNSDGKVSAFDVPVFVENFGRSIQNPDIRRVQVSTEQRPLFAEDVPACPVDNYSQCGTEMSSCPWTETFTPLQTP